MPMPKAGAWRGLVSVMVDPGGTFTRLKEAPNVVAPLLCLAVFNAVFTVLTLPKVREIALLQMEQAGSVPPEQMAMAMKVMNIAAPAGAGVTALVAPLGIALVFLLLGQFVEADAPFKSLVCVAGYSQVPLLVKGAVTTVIAMLSPAQDMIHITTGLALVLPREQAGTALFRALSYADPFSWWGVYLLVVGYGILNGFSTKKSAGVVLSLYLVYVVLSFFVFKSITPTVGV